MTDRPVDRDENPPRNLVNGRVVLVVTMGDIQAGRMATCPYCGEFDDEGHRCGGRRRLFVRAAAAGVGGAALGAFGALLVMDSVNAAFLVTGALLGAVLVIAVWQAAWMHPLR